MSITNKKEEAYYNLVDSIQDNKIEKLKECYDYWLDITKNLSDEELFEYYYSLGEPLMIAIYTDTNIDIIKYIISKNKCLVNFRNEFDDNTTSLIYSVEQNNVELVKLLLFEAKANPDIENDEGDTALIKAVKNKNYEIVEVLLHCGANIDIKNKYKKKAKDYASKKMKKILSIIKEKQRKNLIKILERDMRIYNNICYSIMLFINSN